ncbi:MAG: ATP-dependent helicase [Candidatus Eremiobacteraeota bacterium]|nr:ATP-dependent helicase [Candidatus Eremiobacteraeota bacterium]
MNDNMLDGLNEQQRKAAKHKDGALLLLAGPGSGKTKVLTRRIVYLLSQSKEEKFHILALTFTKKAANEMKKKVQALVGDEISRLFIGTFHSFCWNVLQTYGNYIGLKSELTVYDKDSSIQLMDECINDLIKESGENLESREFFKNVKRNISTYYHKFEQWKNTLKPYDEIYENKEEIPELILLFKKYNETLIRSGALDYGDLVYYTLQLFHKKKFILRQYRTSYRYILVDEGQDTNWIQYKFLNIFCGEVHKNVFIVADEDQLLYEWNGANLRYLLNFVKEFKADKFQLLVNYRCPNEIIEIASSLIEKNIIRTTGKKPMESQKAKPNCCVFLESLNSPDDEIDFITKKIIKINDFKNTCVMARNRYILEPLRQKFEEIGIEVYMPMREELFATDEFKSLIIILNCVFNEDSIIHIRQFYNYFRASDNLKLEEMPIPTPKPDMQSTVFARVLNFLSENEETGKPWSIKLINLLQSFLLDKNSFFKYINEILGFIIGKTKEKVLSTDSEENELLRRDYDVLDKIIRKYKSKQEDYTLNTFLSEIALSGKDEYLSINGVSLLTVHAAKGLEYDYVFIMTLNERVFPDYRALSNTRKIEEERRSCYVAVTRTKKQLYLSYTKFRTTRYGTWPQEPSRFLEEMGLL